METLRIILCSLCAIFLYSLVVEGGPVRANVRSNRERRMAKEFPDFNITPTDNATSTYSDTCLNNGFEVPRTGVHCEKRVGCRAIQKTGQCCPDYQCECEKDGKTYGNGEKLVNSESPCQVCYCQGGEFSCNNVTCYIRNDCEPKYIPGRCCPEYDNCPPLEHVKFPQSSKDSPNEVHDNIENSSHTVFSLTDNHSPETTATQSTTTTSDLHHNHIANGNNLGFKIKEITKVEEIRITDQNPQPKISKFTTTTTRTTPTTTSTYSPTTFISTTENEEDYSGFYSTTEDNVGSFSSSTEYPNLFENTDHILPGETLKNVRHTDYDAKIKDSVEESSFLSDNKINVSNRPKSEETDIASNFAYFGESTSEEPRSGHSSTEDYAPSSAAPEEAPKVVVLGNNVLILDNSKPNPITLITVEDAVGLQRGVDENLDDSETYPIEAHPIHHASDSSTAESSTTELSESSPIPTNTKETTAEQTHNQNDEPVFETVFYQPADHETLEAFKHNSTLMEDEMGSASGSGPIVLADEPDQGSGSGFEITNITKLIPVTADSTEFQDHISSSYKPDPSVGSGDYSGDAIFDTTFTEIPSSPEVSSEIVQETTFYEPSSDVPTENDKSQPKPTESSGTNHFTVDELLPIHKPYIEDDDHLGLINPGYGKLPDDLHIHSGNDEELSNTRQLAAKKHDELETPPAHSELSKQSKLVEAKQLLKSPGEPHLIPEWERNSTETESQSTEINTTEETVPVSIKLEQILSRTVNPLHADHSSSEEIDRKFNKDVEPTTIRYVPTKAVEIFSTEEDSSTSQSSNLTKETLDHEVEVLKIRQDPDVTESTDSTEFSSVSTSVEITTDAILETIQSTTIKN